MPDTDEQLASLDSKIVTEVGTSIAWPSNQPEMGSRSDTAETIPGASAGPTQHEGSHDPSQQPGTPAASDKYVHISPDEPSAPLHRDPTADASSCEMTAKTSAPPLNRFLAVEDIDITSEDELEALFDADLEAEFEAFEQLSQGKEAEEPAAHLPIPRELEGDASIPNAVPCDTPAKEEPHTPSEESLISSSEQPSTPRTPDLPKDWFGPSFEEDLEAGIQYLEEWTQDDEYEEAVGQPLTPAGSEEEVFSSEAESSESPADEGPHTPGNGSSIPERPTTDRGSREISVRAPTIFLTLPKDVLDDEDDDVARGAESETGSGEAEQEETQYIIEHDVSTPAESSAGSPKPSREPTNTPDSVSPASSKEEQPRSPYAQPPQTSDADSPHTFDTESAYSPSVESPRTPGVGSPHTPRDEPPWSPKLSPPVQLTEESATEVLSQETAAGPQTIPVDDVLTNANIPEDTSEVVHTPIQEPTALVLADPAADPESQETAKQSRVTPDAQTTPLDDDVRSEVEATEDDHPLSDTATPEDTRAESGELPSKSPACLQTDTRSRETTAQLPETPPQEASIDMDADASKLDKALPNYSISEAGDTSVSERPRTESEAVLVLLGAYLASSPLSKKTGVQPSATSLVDVQVQEDVHAHNDESPVQPETDPPADVEAPKPTAQSRALPATPVTGVPVETQDKEVTQDDSDSLPDYESLPDDVDELRDVAPAPEDTQPNETQRHQIELTEPTPRVAPQQAEASSSNPAATNTKRRRSATCADPGQVAKRIRTVLQRTPSPQPPCREVGEGASTSTGAVEANKRRRSSDPGPRPATKRPRIVLKRRTPQPAPSQAAAHATPQGDPSVPPSGLGQKASQAWLEDQISPKTVVQPPLPAEEASPPKKKGTRKPKPPPPDKPSISNLTWASVESLLPASAFGQASWIHRRFWTVKEEIELRRAWSEADESCLSITHSEVLVGRFVTELYGCQLADLFRYGLKYIPPQPDRNGNPVDDAFWINLLRLLPHPFFLGKIEILRYALQGAVYYRTSDFAAQNLHVKPFMPPWSHQEPGYISWLKELRGRYPEGSAGYNTKTVEIVEASEWRCQTQVENKMWMQELCGIMDELAGPFASRFPAPQELDPVEHYLFVLTERDLAFLEACLDELDRAQRGCQEQRPLTWQELHSWKEYPEGEIPYVEEHRGYHRSDVEFSLNPPAPPPPPAKKKNVPLRPVTVDSSFLEFWASRPAEAKFVAPEAGSLYRAERRLAVLSERREALVRRKIGAKGGREPRVVLDVPPFDPDPDFHLFEQTGRRGSNRAGLMVVRGVYTTPAAAEWLGRWTRRKADEAGTGKTRRNPHREARAVVAPDSAVGRVLGSGYVPVRDPPVDGPLMPVVEGSARRGDGVAAQQAEARTSIVQQHAAYRRREFTPPILSMGGGLWARRKGKEVVRE